eukprot:CAMPEP_0195288244 /NCGR_PEP_ID=MMETSP0707-20130614/4987_1 /TAXON_ID=33640 /ORGANISM="Asterionellopsis glacialis, Strain CCMP134" /LENGTH=367 /DNA_ID=CAMNT_0040348081 /DNA_START=302 /DNA_END=1401 /DNA_ORIENTATION=-
MSSGMFLLQELQLRRQQQQLKKQKQSQKISPVTQSIESSSLLPPSHPSKNEQEETPPPSATTKDHNNNDLFTQNNDNRSIDQLKHGLSSLQQDQVAKPLKDDIQITVCTGTNCGALKQDSRRRHQHQGGNGDSKRRIENSTAACSACATHQEHGEGGSGTGTSAALIEIEELITEYHFQKEQGQQEGGNNDASSLQEHVPYLQVTSAGCTHHCTVGPNVFVRRMKPQEKVKAFVGKQQEKSVQHFTRVDSVTQCNRVMDYALEVNQDDEKTGNSLLLQRRADGIRWKALRELVRTEAASQENGQTQFHNHYKENTISMLQKAHEAEIMAAGTDLRKQERAKRRSKRLFTRLDHDKHILSTFCTFLFS